MRALFLLVLLAACVARAEAPFPRLMGMNIGAKHYDDPAYQAALARLDVVMLGFYRGWTPPGYPGSSAAAMREVVRALKARNPALLVGQYTVLNEVRADPGDVATRDLQDKLAAERWWLLDGRGAQVQWTSDYGTWEVNLTPLVMPDAQGRRWPEWLAERNHAVYFREVPEFDLVFIDNVMNPPRVTGDWNGDGANDDRRHPLVLAAHFQGHLAYWRRLRELMPNALLVANVDHDLSNPEWRGVLDGAFLEGLMGERWSVETRHGWAAMMRHYRAVLANTRAPHLVGFNVHGDPKDYRFFRYAYASCLLDDGAFSFTEAAAGYSSVPWFDEYDVELGKALGPPPQAAWMNGVWRRDFEHGTVLVNPTGMIQTVPAAGLRRIAGRQDPLVNSGAATQWVRLRPRDGIVLRR